ncbi:serine/threonine protein kinase [Azospirillum sp. RWY-5-1]|uniref:Serine/threonine protein kinase n=1 Tax=Azospirillum oleiclasticum TaxID=2735135 RepID=A0ABX2TLY1_9PROT|nr:serine/threonine-protein kinase [Azospirillum oleiclasticum]NYZ17899.1 serine/threonine protein kinase [Azospirillum oleiclasticum]NYZ25107.1 serine/threonine protein kinase [Azospirillum oleiclasticum]
MELTTEADGLTVGVPDERSLLVDLRRDFDTNAESPTGPVLELTADSRDEQEGARRMVDVTRLQGVRLGSYVLGDRLGHGYFGAVYAAEVVVGGEVIAKPVAVKVLNPALLDPGDPLRELRNAMHLRHPHLIAVEGHPGETVVTAHGVTGSVFWFVMERAEGTLAARLERGPLTEVEIDALIRQVGGALAWLHREGWVHRDVKPGNILRVGDVWKLGDLGLARMAVDGPYAQAKGTTVYLAPESFERPAPQPSWDVWAFGLTLLAAFGGRHPADGKSDREWLETLFAEEALPLPPLAFRLEEIVAGCLEKAPERRWTAQRLAALPYHALRHPALAAWAYERGGVDHPDWRDSHLVTASSRSPEDAQGFAEWQAGIASPTDAALTRGMWIKQSDTGRLFAVRFRPDGTFHEVDIAADGRTITGRWSRTGDQMQTYVVFQDVHYHLYWLVRTSCTSHHGIEYVDDACAPAAHFTIRHYEDFPG